ncbi:Uncharacterized protein PHSC3_000209 [Chlamydiales bacterium STE3]|nr:Uncharacterized protein PHSC3_000209 [Chlamydiales bacterium STE3]
MRLPTLLPEDLSFVQDSASDLELYERLLKNTEQLIRFFSAAVDDETWTEQHQDFIKRTLHWFTNQFFLGRLDWRYALTVSQSIYAHPYTLAPLYPRNISIKTQGKLFPINSLLLGVQSFYLYHMILKQCRDKGSKVLKLSIEEKDIAFVIEYLERGRLDYLWKLEKNEIISLLDMAGKLYLDPLSFECQSILQRYITSDNVLETLILAHQKHWYVLKEKSIEYCNQLDWGVTLYAMDQDLGFEFHEFTDQTEEIFSKLNSLITHLTVSGFLSLEPSFAKVLQLCPKLISLNLSGSEKISPYLEAVPKKVKELILARCIWLKDQTMLALIDHFLQISHLNLSQNTNLTYLSLGEIKKLFDLKSLSLASCHQIGDRELSLILQSASQLREVDLSNCRSITEAGFLELAQILIRLNKINVSRTFMTDTCLVELANRAQFIEYADFSRCSAITERGVYHFVKAEANLKEIYLADCRLAEESLRLLKENYPKLKIIDLP